MDVSAWIKEAALARDKAYAPYSGFRVGCALIGADGTVFHGCNIENGAYGPTNCAERTALFRAIADGQAPRSFQALVVIGDTPEPITPCGVCRQVMIELCSPDMPVYMANLAGDVQETTVSDLLPGAFMLRV
ncbi:cytidine deaminase [Paenibacillus sp. J2TS4]|uniref:cytidine deaminase n=1 Tax=Paenibacillus sp. J2TS4 TaxID=2807194 RepID=UPI001B275C6D|nr:cytidine deaminase [Paenibacillus sp. J2TS4]GIP35826.1 cytidine deaminase [Paenibacillus sp. J2TS4]